MSHFFKKFWHGEIAEISEKYRWVLSLFAITFVALFSYQFTLLMHHMSYLGPGLGEEPSTEFINRLIFDRLSGPNAIYGWLMGLFVLSILLFRASIILWSYFGYKKTFGKKFPIRIVLIFILVNTIGALSIPVVLFLAGCLLVLLGYDFNHGWHFIQNTVAVSHNWVMTNIPTLIDMPSAIAILCVFMLAGFVHYWLHRLGHEFRALWLLFHRHHHMTPNLVQFSTVAVFFAFPLFILFLLPYTVIFASISKLFSSEPLYLEMFILNCFILIPEIFGHSDVFYEKVNRNRFVTWSSFILGNGIYHYLHHSAEVVDSTSSSGKNRQVNMVNMGGGFFFIWDRLFGTFRPLRKERPEVGLTGSPALYMNPLRLALSGVAQLGYEIKMNKGWCTRFKILFGASEYVPPISHDFAIKVQL